MFYIRFTHKFTTLDRTHAKDIQYVRMLHVLTNMAVKKTFWFVRWCINSLCCQRKMRNPKLPIFLDILALVMSPIFVVSSL